MKSTEEIELLLTRLGADWPAESSIVAGVMETVGSRPTAVATPKHRRILVKSLLGIAASLAVVAASWWAIEGNRNSLYAQAIDALHNARTIHVIGYVQTKAKTAPVKGHEAWYESGVGFRDDLWSHNSRQSIRLGNKDYSWRFSTDLNLVVRSRSKGILEETEEAIADIDRHARQLQDGCRRDPESDQTFDGQPCKAYRAVNLGRYLKSAQYHDASPLPVDVRLFLYVDQQSRLVRVEWQRREDNHWAPVWFNVIRYDETFDPAIFRPDFGKNVKFVDADAKSDQVVKPVKLEGPVLTYEVDPKSKPAGMTAANMDYLVKVVDGRLNPGPEQLAIVRKLDDRRLEVAMIRRDEADKKRIEKQLARSGTLEFRILANNRVDNAVINRARKEPAKTDVLDSSGKHLAWWVPVKPGSELTNPDIVRRSRKANHREIMDVLVVADPYNVTGAYLIAAKGSVGRLGEHCVDCTLNDAGGKLFGKLTGDHLPDKLTNFGYKLGIILDGELVSAPSVRSKIYDRVVLTGSFTKKEVSDLAATLNAGSLPVRLRLVEEHPHSEQDTGASEPTGDGTRKAAPQPAAGARSDRVRGRACEKNCRIT